VPALQRKTECCADLHKVQAGLAVSGGVGSSVVYNPLHPPARLASDIVHELAHVLLNHRLSRVEQLNGISFLSCDVDQEEEANWLAGCLLLPRPLLMSCLLRRMDEAAIATSHGVSEQMVTYRINVTGVRRQLARIRRP